MIVFRDYAATTALRAAQERIMSLPAGTYTPASITVTDRSNEKSVFQIYATVLTAGNFVAQQALFTTLFTTANAITLGLFSQTNFGNQVLISNSYPNVNGAQREIKLLIMFNDNTNQQKFTATLPTIDPDMLTFLPMAKDFVAITEPTGASTQIVDFIAAFNAFAVSPVGNHAVTIQALKFVGRNS